MKNSLRTLSRIQKFQIDEQRKLLNEQLEKEEQLEKQLNKVVDVIKVRTIPQQDLISRELMLIKCTATGRTRSEILDIAKIMNANIVDLTKTTMTLEICDLPDRLDLLEELLKAYNIQEVMRTGTIALQKGGATISVK